MRILVSLLLLALLNIGSALAQSNPPLTIREVDGVPSKVNASALVFPNGSLTISGGVVTVSFVVASAVTGTGTADTVPLWTSSTAIGNSVLTQVSGSLVQPTGNLTLSAGRLNLPLLTSDGFSNTAQSIAFGATAANNNIRVFDNSVAVPPRYFALAASLGGDPVFSVIDDQSNATRIYISRITDPGGGPVGIQVNNSGANGGYTIDTVASLDGYIKLANDANNSFTALVFGQLTSNWPMIKVGNTPATVTIRLADDTADAPLGVSNLRATGRIGLGSAAVPSASNTWLAITNAVQPTASFGGVIDIISSNSTSFTQRGINITTTDTGSPGGSVGLNLSQTLTTTGLVTDARGFNATQVVSAGASFTNIFGNFFTQIVAGTVTTANANANTVRVTSATGAVTTANASLNTINGLGSSAGAAIGTANGVNVSGWTKNSLAVTESRGIFLDTSIDSFGTTSYAILSRSASQSRMVGSLKLGADSAPAQVLDVTGNAVISGTINGNTFTAGSFTLTGAAAKTLTFNNSLTLAGTDATTMTFPTTSATIARTDAAQTFTGVQTFASLAMGANLSFSSTAPTVSAGFGTSPSIAGTSTSFTITIGTGGTADTGTVTFPAAATGWVCQCNDVTNNASFVTSQTGGSTTTATFQNYSRTTGSAIAWTAADVLRCSAIAY